MSQKFNLDGTLDGKRHPKAHVIESTPGPGSYNIKSDLGGPKYTIGLKRITKSLSQNSLGPGAYELRKDSSLIKPCYKFDTEKRENLEINKSTKNFPGPGTYKDVNVLESKGFKWTIPQDGRFTKIKPRNTKLVRLKVPGPGSYNIKNLIGREGPKYTFNKVRFNHSDEVDESMKEKTLKYPSPTTYLQRIDYVSDLPKYTIPKFDLSKLKEKSTTPGPWNYNPSIEYYSIFKKVTNCIISKARRDEDGSFKEGIRMTITTNDDFVDLNIDKFLEFFAHLNYQNMYLQAEAQCNYAKMSPHGLNTYNMKGGLGSGGLNGAERMIENNYEYEPNNNDKNLKSSRNNFLDNAKKKG
jgi:hypothetical protein